MAPGHRVLTAGAEDVGGRPEVWVSVSLVRIQFACSNRGLDMKCYTASTTYWIDL
jgi:hypothetical protein